MTDELARDSVFQRQQILLSVLMGKQRFRGSLLFSQHDTARKDRERIELGSICLQNYVSFLLNETSPFITMPHCCGDCCRNTFVQMEMLLIYSCYMNCLMVADKTSISHLFKQSSCIKPNIVCRFVDKKNLSVVQLQTTELTLASLIRNRI